jgi:hypothetical protein
MPTFIPGPRSEMHGQERLFLPGAERRGTECLAAASTPLAADPIRHGTMAGHICRKHGNRQHARQGSTPGRRRRPTTLNHGHTPGSSRQPCVATWRGPRWGPWCHRGTAELLLGARVPAGFPAAVVISANASRSTGTSSPLVQPRQCMHRWLKLWFPGSFDNEACSPTMRGILSLPISRIDLLELRKERNVGGLRIKSDTKQPRKDRMWAYMKAWDLHENRSALSYDNCPEMFSGHGMNLGDITHDVISGEMNEQSEKIYKRVPR